MILNVLSRSVLVSSCFSRRYPPQCGHFSSMVLSTLFYLLQLSSYSRETLLSFPYGLDFVLSHCCQYSICSAHNQLWICWMPRIELMPSNFDKIALHNSIHHWMNKYGKLGRNRISGGRQRIYAVPDLLLPQDPFVVESESIPIGWNV